ncbi:MAG: TPM domain-containing protein [Clostridia bacterium]|nr:TPM domain-containing protein [Clostridia bacterium]
MNNHIHFRRLSVLVLCAMLLVTLAIPAFAAYPTHKDFISDPDSVLSDTTTAAILSANDALYKSREVKIAVCLTDSTGDESITDFSRNLFSKWEMCDGVLLVLDTNAQTYFAVQSVDIDDIVTNAVLSDILANNMEAEFAAGNTDRAVMKTVTALSQFMSSSLPAPEGAETADTAVPETDENGEPVEEKEPSGFVKFMKAILWLIIIAVVLAAGIFVLAMFNDDVADLLRTYIFRRGSAQPVSRTDYYDDRLYGNQNTGRRNPQNPYNPNGYNGQQRRQGQYPPRQQSTQRLPSGYDTYNDYDMQYQQPRSPRPQQGRQGQNGQYRQNPNPGYGQNYNPNYGQRPEQGQRRPNQNGQYPNNRKY